MAPRLISIQYLIAAIKMRPDIYNVIKAPEWLSELKLSFLIGMSSRNLTRGTSIIFITWIGRTCNQPGKIIKPRIIPSVSARAKIYIFAGNIGLENHVSK